jgi:hypothetical protein
MAARSGDVRPAHPGDGGDATGIVAGCRGSGGGAEVAAECHSGLDFAASLGHFGRGDPMRFYCLSLCCLLCACSDRTATPTAPLATWSAALTCEPTAATALGELAIATSGPLPLTFPGRSSIYARIDPRFDRRLDLASAQSSTALTPTDAEAMKVPFILGLGAAAGVAPLRFIQSWNVGFGSDAQSTCTTSEFIAAPGLDGRHEVRAIQQSGKQDLSQAAAGAADAMNWVDRRLPGLLMQSGLCPKSADASDPQSLPWCWPTILQVEYGRDPFGTGGWSWSDKQDWLAGYAALLAAVRIPFSLPGNGVPVGGPATPERADASSNSQAMEAFLDFLAASKAPISFLSAEITAATPKGVAAVVSRLSASADSRGLKSDFYKHLPIRVSDLRMDPDSWPVATKGDYALQATWLGSFYLGSAILLAGKTDTLTVGRTAPLTADCGQAGDPRSTWPADLRVFGVAGIADGTPSAASWWIMPFRRATGGFEVQRLLQEEKEAIYVLVTTAYCNESTDGKPRGICNPGQSLTCDKGFWDTDPEYSSSSSHLPPGTTRTIRVVVADMHTPDSPLGSIEVQAQLPPGVTSAFVRQSSMAGRATWTKFAYDREQTVAAPDGIVRFQFDAGGPSMHFAEAYF